MPGLGSGYGPLLTPQFAALTNQAIAAKQGLGQLQEQELQRQKMQQLDATWKNALSRANGDVTTALRDREFVGIIGPQAAATFEAQYQAREAAKRKEMEAQAAAAQKQQAVSRFAETVAPMPRTFEPTVENDAALAAAQRVRAGLDVGISPDKFLPAAALNGDKPQYDQKRGVWVYPDGRTVKPENLPPEVQGAPDWRKRNDGKEEVLEEWNGGRWVEISRAPRTGSGIVDPFTDPEVIAAAESIYAGQAPPDYYTKRSDFRAAVTQYLRAKHPDFNLTESGALAKFRQDSPTNRSIAVLESILNPGGKADSVLDEYGMAHEKLGLTRFPAANSAIIAYKQQTGDPDVVRYINLRNALSMEIGQALGAAALTDKRMEVEMENLAKAASPEQAKAIVQVIRDLVSARLKAFKQQQGRPTGEGAPNVQSMSDEELLKALGE